MPILKSPDLFQASTVLFADGTLTGPTVDLREKYGTTIAAVIQNGATGPSAPAEFAVEISTDNFVADTMEIHRTPASTESNAKSPFLYTLPPQIMYARTVFYGGTGQSVTPNAWGHTVDTLG